MAIHSSILPWRIPWTEKSGGLQSIGLHRVGHDRSDLACMHGLGYSCPEGIFISPQSQPSKSVVSSRAQAPTECCRNSKEAIGPNLRGHRMSRKEIKVDGRGLHDSKVDIEYPPPLLA